MSTLFLLLHVGFAIFTLGPLTAALMAAPRAIRAKNVPVLRSIERTTRIYGIGSLGVFIFGLVLGIVLGGGILGRWYMSASMTLFLVGVVLLFLIHRDLRAATKALDNEDPTDDAQVQSGRIAAIGGLLGLIWVVILILMIVPE
jgi:MFS family permease